jgi:hypothetical protein
MLPVAQTFRLAEIAEAHRISEKGRVRGTLVVVVGSPMSRGDARGLGVVPTKVIDN